MTRTIVNSRRPFVPLILVMGLVAVSVGQPKLTVLPNESVPRTVRLENDSLFVEIELGRSPSFTSLRHKSSKVDFIPKGTSAPIVNVNNNWHLLQLGFNLWKLRELKSAGEVGVEIELWSNYLENPNHVFIQLVLNRSSELRLNVWLSNQADSLLHDMRYVGRPTLSAGLTFMKFANPTTTSPYVIFKKGYISFHQDTTGMGMYFLRQPDAPVFPTVAWFPSLGVGLLLNKEASDLDWSFGNAEEALAFQRQCPLPPGRSFTLFRGTLRPFVGDWQQAFSWWKTWLRSRWDLRAYEREGHRSYRQRMLGNLVMAFDQRLYDHTTNRFQVDAYIDQGSRSFGGFDFLIFWHAYPRIGVDPRDQWEMLEDLPGGLNGIRDLIESARRRNVEVFLSYNPWDARPGSGSTGQQLGRLVANTRTAGVYLDILRGADQETRAVLDSVNPNIVFSSENRPSFEGLEISTGSQEDHDYVNEMPRLDLLRFVLPEHNIQNTERAGRNRVNMIRNALFNLTGLTIWEDIFGELNFHTSPEKLLVQRYYRLVHDHMDAVLDTMPKPMIPAVGFPRSLGSNPFMTSTLPPAVRDERLRTWGDSVRLYVNQFTAPDKILFSTYFPERDRTDRYHDNRVSGRLFRAQIPKGWHVVNVWDGLPAEIIQDASGSWVSVSYELPDESCVFVATPNRISVTASADGWEAIASGQTSGELVLVGIDELGRLVSSKRVPTTQILKFRPTDVTANEYGYVLLQWVHNGVVQDALPVKVR